MRERGAALIIAVFALALLSLLGMTFLSMAGQEHALAAKHGQRLQADYAAQAGMVQALEWVKNHPDQLIALPVNAVLLPGEEAPFQAAGQGNGSFSQVLLIGKVIGVSEVTAIFLVSGRCGTAVVNLKAKIVLNLLDMQTDLVYWRT